MKRDLRNVACGLLLFSFALMPCAARGQSGWYWQNPVLQGNPLLAVYFVDANNGTAVGENGIIIHTTNGGDSWVVQNSTVTFDLYDVDFINANTGTAVGELGAVHTTDGGATWTNQITAQGHWLKHVHFADANNGIATDDYGDVLKTTNGGSLWYTPQDLPTNRNAVYAYCSDSNNEIIVANQFYRTTDGGANWISHPILDNDSLYLEYYDFLNLDTVIAVGLWGAVIRTTDGGETWTRQTSGTANDFITAVCFLNANTGVIVGYDTEYNNIILRTTNCGATWQQQINGHYPDFAGISFINTRTETVVGYGGIILRSNNDGYNWIDQTKSVTMRALYGVVFPDSLIGYIVGESGVLIHNDLINCA